MNDNKKRTSSYGLKWPGPVEEYYAKKAVSTCGTTGRVWRLDILVPLYTFNPSDRSTRTFSPSDNSTLKLLDSDKDLATLILRVNIEFNKVVYYFRSHKLSFYPGKTKFMIFFHRNFANFSVPSLQINFKNYNYPNDPAPTSQIECVKPSENHALKGMSSEIKGGSNVTSFDRSRFKDVPLGL